MVAFKGHFDGHVIIPQGQLDLPRDLDMLFQVEPLPRLVNGRELLKYSGILDAQTADQMLAAIKDCERIDDGW